MNNTRMRSEQDPDEYLYIMDSCRDRLNACDPPEGPTHRQYEDKRGYFTGSSTARI